MNHSKCHSFSYYRIQNDGFKNPKVKSLLPKVKSLLAIVGVAAMAAWALFDSSSLVEHNLGENDFDSRTRSLSLPKQPDGEVYLTSDKPLQKFIIISQQRSGTGFFTSLLDHHENVRCGHEEFYLRLGYLSLHDLLKEGTFGEYMEKFHFFVDELSEGVDATENLTHVGFEIMHNQGILLHGSRLIHELNKENIRVIHLIRRNKFLQYISDRTNAKDIKMNMHHSDISNTDDKTKHAEEKTHNPHPTDKTELTGIRSIQLESDVEDILNYLDEKSEEDSEVENLLSAEFGNDGYLTVYYEDLNNDKQGEMNRVFDFLGVEHEVVSSDLIKIHEGKRAREYFKEKTVVQNAIRDSKYAFVLDADLPSYPGW
ncbi:hypothetical protein ACHAXS_005523 [Conticribra weissflogii]